MNDKWKIALELLDKAVDEATDILKDGQVTLGEVVDSAFDMASKMGKTLAPEDWHKVLYTVNKKHVTPAGVVAFARDTARSAQMTFGVYELRLK